MTSRSSFCERGSKQIFPRLRLRLAISRLLDCACADIPKIEGKAHSRLRQSLMRLLCEGKDLLQSLIGNTYAHIRYYSLEGPKLYQTPINYLYRTFHIKMRLKALSMCCKQGLNVCVCVCVLIFRMINKRPVPDNLGQSRTVNRWITGAFSSCGIFSSLMYKFMVLFQSPSKDKYLFIHGLEMEKKYLKSESPKSPWWKRNWSFEAFEGCLMSCHSIQASEDSLQDQTIPSTIAKINVVWKITSFFKSRIGWTVISQTWEIFFLPLNKSAVCLHRKWELLARVLIGSLIVSR